MDLIEAREIFLDFDPSAYAWKDVFTMWHISNHTHSDTVGRGASELEAWQDAISKFELDRRP